MSHEPFIAIAYAVFAILVAADVMLPLIKRREVLRRLRGRLLRERRRETP